jgi:superfamily I DNA and/or RNA helicase
MEKIFVKVVELLMQIWKKFEVTLAYINRLCTDFKVDLSDIGVISPYRHQNLLLSRRISRLSIVDAKKISVEIVEKYQGSERKIIIMSATRTDRIGFVGCDLVSFYGF